MSQTLIPYPERQKGCRGWTSTLGTHVPCTRTDIDGQCSLCGALDRATQNAKRRWQAVTKGLQTTTYGPAPDGENPFRGL